jgi:hypothetical protein
MDGHKNREHIGRNEISRLNSRETCKIGIHEKQLRRRMAKN